VKLDGESDAAAAPRLVVFGSSTRDVDDTDSRGWRLGGPATYAALAAARLGVVVTCVLGVDRSAEAAGELELLLEAGIDLRLRRLETVPVFDNRSSSRGRRQRLLVAGSTLAVSAARDLPPAAASWSLSGCRAGCGT
jgi:hypothetical protein